MWHETIQPHGHEPQVWVPVALVVRPSLKHRDVAGVALHINLLGNVCCFELLCLDRVDQVHLVAVEDSRRGIEPHVGLIDGRVIKDGHWFPIIVDPVLDSHNDHTALGYGDWCC